LSIQVVPATWRIQTILSGFPVEDRETLPVVPKVTRGVPAVWLAAFPLSPFRREIRELDHENSPKVTGTQGAVVTIAVDPPSDAGFGATVTVAASM
jgi:hypothetical protein